MGGEEVEWDEEEDGDEVRKEEWKEERWGKVEGERGKGSGERTEDKGGAGSEKGCGDGRKDEVITESFIGVIPKDPTE